MSNGCACWRNIIFIPYHSSEEQCQQIQKEFLDTYIHYHQQIPDLPEEYGLQIYYLVRGMPENFENENPYWVNTVSLFSVLFDGFLISHTYFPTEKTGMSLFIKRSLTVQDIKKVFGSLMDAQADLRLCIRICHKLVFS